MANNTGMAEHHVSVTVDAPVHQVYSMFTHFNDFPKFMSFVKEVTYYDDQRSHWVAEVAGRPHQAPAEAAAAERRAQVQEVAADATAVGRRRQKAHVIGQSAQVARVVGQPLQFQRDAA